MNESISIDQVLRVEDDAGLMDIVEPQTGVPAWLLVRNYFFRLVIEGMLYASEGLRRHEPTYRVSDMLRAAFVSIAHNATLTTAPVPVVILGSGAGAMSQDGRRIDRLTTYFADALGTSAWSELGIHMFSLRYAVRAPRVTLTAHRRLADRALARVAVGDEHSRRARNVIGIAARSAERLLGWRIDEALCAGLERRLALELASTRQVIARVRQLKRRHRPRLVLADQCCYGTKAILNAVLHDEGVEVIEYQHGVITRAHEAYNYGGPWPSYPPVQRALPGAILLYGAWWATQINLPVNTLVVGNPHRERAVGGLAQIGREDGSVLVLGDGIDTGFYEGFCATLAAALPHHRIVFRPHPLEREHAVQRHRQLNPRYEIDVAADIYGSFANASWVAAEISTGLFEVAGTHARPVVIDSKKSRFNFPDDPFPRVEGPEMLAALIRGELQHPGHAGRDLWASDWRPRFDGHMREFVPGLQGS